MSKARRFCQQLYNSGSLFVDNSITLADFSCGFFSDDGEFAQWKKVNGSPLKPETARRYNTAITKHIIPFLGDYRLGDITRDVCKQWIMWASERWSPKTVNLAQGTLNLILESAMEKDIINRNPLYRLGFRNIEKKKRQLLTVEELRALYAGQWPTELHREMFLLAAVTGMRLGEIVALQSSDIHEGFIDVHSDYSDRYGFQETTKTSMNRCVPIPEGFVFPKSEGFVFSRSDGSKPVKGHCLYNALTRRCDSLGIDKKARGITFHSLRSFFISYLQSQNVNESKIRAVVGHADETMTDIYTYWTPDMFPEVYEAQKKLFSEITK